MQSVSTATSYFRRLLLTATAAILVLLSFDAFAQCPGTPGPELVTNGNFDGGITDFTSEYVYGTGGPSGLLHNDGEFATATNPNDTHIDFDTFGDHTSGTGNMLVINGAGTPNVNIWCQTFAVLPNTTYYFSTWAATCNWQSPAVLQFSINGVLVGSSRVDLQACKLEYSIVSPK